MINKKVSLNSELQANKQEHKIKSDNCKTPECNRSSIEEKPTSCTLIDNKSYNKDGFQLKKIEPKRIDFSQERNILDAQLLIGFKLSPLRSQIRIKNLNENSDNTESQSNSLFSEVSSSSFDTDSVEIIDYTKSKKINSSNLSENSCPLSKKMSHYIIPCNKINNESFKIKAMYTLRKPEFTSHKSINFKMYNYGRRAFNYDGNITKFCDLYHYKRRKIFTDNKHFYSTNVLIDDSGKKSLFTLFKDRDIGFTKQWQKKIKLTTMDDDVLTDEEQLELSYNHIISELEEGLSTFQRRKEKLKF